MRDSQTTTEEEAKLSNDEIASRANAQRQKTSLPTRILEIPSPIGSSKTSKKAKRAARKRRSKVVLEQQREVPGFT